jgi:serine/threonine protein kinase
VPTDRQRRIRELFDAASDQPLDLQQVFLEQACDGDEDLLRAVSTLLRARNRSGGLIDTPLHQRPAAAVSPIQSGVRVGPYKVLRQLGAGGMGLVYQVLRADQVFQRVAALKIIRPEFAAPKLVERFRQEREILARLDHSNIARIIDGGSTADGLPYFVMDYVDGLRIDQYCAQKSLPVRDRLLLFQQVCSAVQYLHHSRVVHGDLKPSNILVTSDGQVKILDFGVARLLQPSETGRTVTDSLALMTPAYGSPEQRNGSEPTDRSDIFSLGVILYELLTGSRPFRGERTAKPVPVNSGTTQIAVPPSSATQNPTATGIPGDGAGVMRSLKGDLDAIALKAIRFDPAERYSSAASMSLDIANYLNVRAVAANPGGIFYRLSKFTRRNRTGLATVSVFLLLSSVVCWQGLELRKRYEKAQQLEEQVRELEEKIRSHGALFDQASRMAPGSPEIERLRQEKLVEIRDLAGAYHTSLSESVRLWPGMTPERRELVDRTTQILLQAEPLLTPDRALREQLAFAWLWLADVRGNPDEPNLHDHAGAIESIHHSQRLAAALAGSSPELERQVRSAAAAIESDRNP